MMDAMVKPRLVLAAVPPNMVGGMWPSVSGMIAAAYAAVDNVPPADLPVKLAEKFAVLWIAVDATDAIRAVLVTELRKTHRGLACYMAAASGESVEDWAYFKTTVENYARAEGCARVVLEGRRGWQKFFPDYHLTVVTLEKELSDA